MPIFDALSVFLFSGSATPTLTATTSSDIFDTVDGGFGLQARMVVTAQYTAASVASGTGTLTFYLDKSTDGTNFFEFAAGVFDQVTLTTTPKAGGITIPFSTEARYVKLRVVLTGTTPTVTLSGAQIALGKI